MHSFFSRTCNYEVFLPSKQDRKNILPWSSLLRDFIEKRNYSIGLKKVENSEIKTWKVITKKN